MTSICEREHLPRSVTRGHPLSRRRKPELALGRIALVLALVLLLAACSRTEEPVEQSIVGQWVNAQGGTIHFYTDNTGFIPGDETLTPAVPSVSFSYYFEDDTHIGIRIDGQDTVVVEIELEGDTMTWRLASGVDSVYRRTR